MKTLTSLLLVMMLTACVTTMDMNQWFVPMDTVKRVAKPVDQVVLLDREPTEREFTVIGLIAPEEAFESIGEALNAIRKTAAHHGADAVFVVSNEKGTALDIDYFGAEWKETNRIQAKAIVWR